MSASDTTAQALSVVPAGTNIPLADAQSLGTFTADAQNTTFTVPETGTYLVTYRVDPNAPVSLTSQVTRNGTAIPGTVYTPAAATDDYTATVVTPLTEGDTLALQLTGGTATVTLQNGVGASLTAVRLA